MYWISKMDDTFKDNPFLNLEEDTKEVEAECITEVTEHEQTTVEERLNKLKSHTLSNSRPSVAMVKLTKEQLKETTRKQKARAALYWHAKLSLNGHSESQILDFLVEKGLVQETCSTTTLKRMITSYKSEYDLIFLKLFNDEYEIEITKGALQAENRLLELINGENTTIAEKAARTFLMHFDRARAIESQLSAKEKDEQDSNKRLTRKEKIEKLEKLLTKASVNVIPIESANES